MSQTLIQGQSAADGIVMGKAIVATTSPGRVDGAEVKSGVKYTVADFYKAVQSTQDQLHLYQQRIQERITESVSQIFNAHLLILNDASFINQIINRIDAGTYVPDAINQVADKYIEIFSNSDNPLFREKVDDLEDLTRRLLDSLSNQARGGVHADYHGRILITPKLFPSDILRFVAEKVEGIILTSGGVTAHISVLARSLEMPLILADASLLGCLLYTSPSPRD